MKLLVKKIDIEAKIPEKSYISDSGFDLFANEDVIIAPGDTVIIKTGIAIQLPTGHEGQIRPRSGITAKTKLRVQLGTIDESYRGEIGIILDNISHNKFAIKNGEVSTESIPYCKLINGTGEYVDSYLDVNSYKIKKGDKIAQLIIAPISHPELLVVNELDDTERSNGGFGSTGV